jgi:hypothetical protein
MTAAVTTREVHTTHRRPDTPAAERASRAFEATSGLAPPIVREVQLSPGQPLETGTRSFFERRFGHDFSKVRVHTDHRAAASVRAVGAQAYTLGNDIAFESGQYAPETLGGVHRLAHELVHVVQQDRMGGHEEEPPRIGEPDSASEREAGHAADVVTIGGSPRRLTAPSHQGAVIQRDLGDVLGGGALGGLAGLAIGGLFGGIPALIGLGIGLVGGLIAGAIFGSGPKLKSLGGEWSTDKYDTIKNGNAEVGVDIDLRFSPQPPTNATKIGLTQTATSTSGGAPLAINPTVGARSIPAGQPGAGAHIDQLAQFRNPMYATGATAAGATLANTPTHGQWGQHGWLYKDAAGKEQTQDAHLIDSPQLAVANNSSQIFESAALAIDGAQMGTTYGSVQWGWTRDGSGNFSKLPLKLVSYGLPTAEFQRAAALWNAANTSTGASTIPLPAMSAAQPSAGTEPEHVEAALKVPDYVTAYLILHGQPMGAMLTALSALNKKGLLTTLHLNLMQAKGVDVVRLRTAIEAVLNKEAKFPLSADFNDWLDPAKNPRAAEIAVIKQYLGMN